jgi:CBS domain containing-hemolysin-like protein
VSAWGLVAGAVLLAANAFFVAAEFALIAARRSKIEQLVAAGSKRAKIALGAMQRLSLMLAGAQLGITMASIGLGYVAEPAVAHLLEGLIERVVEVPAGLLHTISFVVALTLVVYLHMFLGEMVPKNIVIAEPERSALLLAGPFRGFAVVARPAMWALNGLADVILRLIGIEPRHELADVHTADEIAAMLAASKEEGVIDEFEHRLMAGALRMGKLEAADVMIPRPEMVTVPAGASTAQCEEVVRSTGHSRLPVCGDDIDDIIGFIHAKDLLRVGIGQREEPLPAGLVRDLLVVPETRDLTDLLNDMRVSHRPFALVIDEYGGTAGITTIEDVLEELVGEIRDEHDPPESEVEPLGPDRFLAPGGIRPDRLGEAIGFLIPEGDYHTLAGFVAERLGRVPQQGDTLEHDGWSVRVVETRRHRVVSVEIVSAGR